MSGEYFNVRSPFRGLRAHTVRRRRRPEDTNIHVLRQLRKATQDDALFSLDLVREMWHVPEEDTLRLPHMRLLRPFGQQSLLPESQINYHAECLPNYSAHPNDNKPAALAGRLFPGMDGAQTPAHKERMTAAVETFLNTATFNLEQLVLLYSGLDSISDNFKAMRARMNDLMDFQGMIWE